MLDSEWYKGSETYLRVWCSRKLLSWLIRNIVVMESFVLYMDFSYARSANIHYSLWNSLKEAIGSILNMVKFTIYPDSPNDINATYLMLLRSQPCTLLSTAVAICQHHPLKWLETQTHTYSSLKRVLKSMSPWWFRYQDPQSVCLKKVVA